MIVLYICSHPFITIILVLHHKSHDNLTTTSTITVYTSYIDGRTLDLTFFMKHGPNLSKFLKHVVTPEKASGFDYGWIWTFKSSKVNGRFNVFIFMHINFGSKHCSIKWGKLARFLHRSLLAHSMEYGRFTSGFSLSTNIA